MLCLGNGVFQALPHIAFDTVEILREQFDRGFSAVGNACPCPIQKAGEGACLAIEFGCTFLHGKAGALRRGVDPPRRDVSHSVHFFRR